MIWSISRNAPHTPLPLIVSLLVLLVGLSGCETEEDAAEEPTHSQQEETATEEIAEPVLEPEPHQQEEEPSPEPITAEEADFLDFQWGMTKDEVVEQLDTVDYRESNVEISVSNETWLGFDTTRDFIFDPDTGELEQIAHRLDTTDMKNEPGYSMAEGVVASEYFTKVQRELESEFGSFEEEHVGFGSLYGDRDFDDIDENQLSVAVGSGAVVSQAVAEPDDDVVIRHWIQFANDEPNHNIVAFDPEHEADNYSDYQRAWEFVAER